MSNFSLRRDRNATDLNVSQDLSVAGKMLVNNIVIADSLAINGGSITTTASTFNFLTANSTLTQLNIGNKEATVSLTNKYGASSVLQEANIGAVGAADDNGIFAAATPVSGVPITLIAAGTASDLGLTNSASHLCPSRLLSIIAAGADSATWTIVGTDLNGAAVTEALVGGSTATVQSVNYFSTVSSMTLTGTIANNSTVGWRSSDYALAVKDSGLNVHLLPGTTGTEILLPDATTQHGATYNFAVGIATATNDVTLTTVATDKFNGQAVTMRIDIGASTGPMASATEIAGTFAATDTVLFKGETANNNMGIGSTAVVTNYADGLYFASCTAIGVGTAAGNGSAIWP